MRSAFPETQINLKFKDWVTQSQKITVFHKLCPPTTFLITKRLGEHCQTSNQHNRMKKREAPKTKS